jgi:hypothetical protein
MSKQSLLEETMSDRDLWPVLTLVVILLLLVITRVASRRMRHREESGAGGLDRAPVGGGDGARA